MANPARVLTSRRNARLSTGPRSAGGKARATPNALGHGLTAPGDLELTKTP